MEFESILYVLLNASLRRHYPNQVIRVSTLLSQPKAPLAHILFSYIMYTIMVYLSSGLKYPNTSL